MFCLFSSYKMSTVLACFSSEENFDEWKKIVSLESFSHKNTTMVPLKMCQRLWKSVQPLSLSPSWFWPARKAACWQGSQWCNWKLGDLLSLWAGGLTPFVHPHLRTVTPTREKVQMGRLWVHLQIATLLLNVPACFMAVLIGLATRGGKLGNRQPLLSHYPAKQCFPTFLCPAAHWTRAGGQWRWCRSRTVHTTSVSSTAGLSKDY